MSALIAAELLKARLTRTTWGFLLAAVALTAARAAMVVANAGTAGGVTAGTTTATVTMVGAAGFGTVALLLWGVTAVTGEFRHATVTATLLNTPRRRSVALAKAAAYALTGAAAGAGLVTIALLTAAATGLAGPPGRDVPRAAAAVVLGAVFFTLLGMAVGLLVRDQTVALAVPLVWLVVVEPLTRSFGLVAVAPWLPGNLPAALGADAAAGAPPPWAAAAALTLYILVLGLLGTRRLERADIT